MSAARSGKITYRSLTCLRYTAQLTWSVKPYVPGVELGQDAEAVMLDFVTPAGSGRRHFGGSWQTKLVAPDLALQLTRYRHAG